MEFLNPFFLIIEILIAPSTPIIVDIAADKRAIIIVFKTITSNLVSWNNSLYQSSVKESKSCMVPPLLNE
jgi:hypothetical protein